MDGPGWHYKIRNSLVDANVSDGIFHLLPPGSGILHGAIDGDEGTEQYHPCVLRGSTSAGSKGEGEAPGTNCLGHSGSSRGTSHRAASHPHHVVVDQVESFCEAI